MIGRIVEVVVDVCVEIVSGLLVAYDALNLPDVPGVAFRHGVDVGVAAAHDQRPRYEQAGEEDRL